MSDSSYDGSQFNVERATGGLVLSLYLGAAIFLIFIVWMVMQNMESPDEESSDSPQTVTVIEVTRVATAPSVHRIFCGSPSYANDPVRSSSPSPIAPLYA